MQRIGLIDLWKGNYTDRSDVMEGLIAQYANDCRKTAATHGNFTK